MVKNKGSQGFILILQSKSNELLPSFGNNNLTHVSFLHYKVDITHLITEKNTIGGIDIAFLIWWIYISEKF